MLLLKRQVCKFTSSVSHLFISKWLHVYIRIRLPILFIWVWNNWRINIKKFGKMSMMSVMVTYFTLRAPYNSNSLYLCWCCLIFALTTRVVGVQLQQRLKRYECRWWNVFRLIFSNCIWRAQHTCTKSTTSGDFFSWNVSENTLFIYQEKCKSLAFRWIEIMIYVKIV